MTAESFVSLPKAHLHLHLEGAMRRQTLVELSARNHRHVGTPPLAEFDHGGDFGKFLALYKAATDAVLYLHDLDRLIFEVLEDQAADGAGWVELSVDPAGYFGRFGSYDAALGFLCESTQANADYLGIDAGLIVVADRMFNVTTATEAASSAAHFADRGVVGFGLAADERHYPPAPFAPAFAIAQDAGLLCVPHAGEYGPSSNIQDAIDLLGAHRVGHGVTSSAATDALLADRQICVEACLTSNVELSAIPTLDAHPLRRWANAGVPVCLNTDDPLLFENRLVDEYALARDVFGMTNAELAQLARDSVRFSAAPQALRTTMLAGIDTWLTSTD